jgi:hypothetical protein
MLNVDLPICHSSHGLARKVNMQLRKLVVSLLRAPCSAHERILLYMN